MSARTAAAPIVLAGAHGAAGLHGLTGA